MINFQRAAGPGIADLLKNTPDYLIANRGQAMPRSEQVKNQFAATGQTPGLQQFEKFLRGPLQRSPRRACAGRNSQHIGLYQPMTTVANEPHNFGNVDSAVAADSSLGFQASIVAPALHRGFADVNRPRDLLGTYKLFQSALQTASVSLLRLYPVIRGPCTAKVDQIVDLERAIAVDFTELTT